MLHYYLQWENLANGEVVSCSGAQVLRSSFLNSPCTVDDHAESTTMKRSRATRACHDDLSEDGSAEDPGHVESQYALIVNLGFCTSTSL